MDWIGWMVVSVACAVVVGLVRERRRRAAAGRHPGELTNDVAAARADRGQRAADAGQVDQRFAGYGGGPGGV